MLRNTLALLLTVLIVSSVQGGQQAAPTIEKQVGQIAKGSSVVVTTNQKKMKTVTGRLGEVTAEGFMVDNVKLRFADVTSVSKKVHHKKISPGVWALALVGGASLLLVIVGGVIASK